MVPADFLLAIKAMLVDGVNLGALNDPNDPLVNHVDAIK
jgi:hypothetical protein